MFTSSDIFFLGDNITLVQNEKISVICIKQTHIFINIYICIYNIYIYIDFLVVIGHECKRKKFLKRETK